MLTPQEARTQLQDAGRYMMAHGLAWGNAGNISARTGEDRYMITASGTFLGELEDGDLVECDFRGGRLRPEDKKPSKELPMHRAVYELRPEVNAVLHASPFYATMVACSDLELKSDWFVETMYYLERVERVPYRHPGSEALGDAVAAHARKANILLLEHHGVLVYDTSVREARMALQTLEMACRMLVTAGAAGVKLRSLEPPIVEDFLHNAGYKPRRKWES
ncbi:class II aldolase/adducin family protein [Paenibacillus sp.]|uniref:class II aldolase/adducin family protein n=1 Tax=Paenibacillus sp. TaxID=58172 RepID=UPI002D743FEB|nr:class II aldolase/adducin family protein [Paenibacillus sp.]HZG57129.1 class II aldolase/adducin family protein [Paenibacillus sp.]